MSRSPSSAVQIPVGFGSGKPKTSSLKYFREFNFPFVKISVKVIEV